MQVEALTAGSPVLHITTQVDREFMDLDRAAIHDVPRQPDMLKAVSKHYVRVREAVGAVDALLKPRPIALTAPSGSGHAGNPGRRAAPQSHVARRSTGCRLFRCGILDSVRLDALADSCRCAKRPLFWLGGGARGASAAATALAERGFGVVTSTNGRAVVPEGHAHSLGAFNMTKEAEQIYGKSDLMIVVGSRLRGNETQNNKMRLPRLVQIDADPAQAGRNYPVELFIAGDARLALEGLLARLPEKLASDPSFLADIGAAAHKRRSWRCARRSVLTRRSRMLSAAASSAAATRGSAM